MPQHTIFGPPTHASEMSLHVVEDLTDGGGGVVVTLKMATPGKGLAAYDVFRLEGYELDFLNTLFDRVVTAWMVNERPRDIRRVVTLVRKAARKHAATYNRA